MGNKYTVVIDDNTAAFLTSVLECVKSVVNSGGYIGFHRGINAEYAAFFFDSFHGNTSLCEIGIDWQLLVNTEKRRNRNSTCAIFS